MKAAFDKIVACFGLILCGPVILVLVPVIRLDSPGPAIFRQKRVGIRGEIFTCYKLRTMKTGTRQVATHEINKSALTTLGRFLRASKIDELPQLYNVLRGEMSLVGPRPCLPVQEDLIRERARLGVFSLLPGITGLGQVRGIDMSNPALLAECDAEYLANRSFEYDLQLIWRTLRGGGQGDRINRL